MARPLTVRLPCLLALALCLAPAPSWADGDVDEALAALMDTWASTGRLQIDGQPILGAATLARFYAQREHAPAWTDPEAVRQLLALVDSAPRHGLDPADYLAGALRARLERGTAPPVATDAAERDVLLGEALLRYLAHRGRGKVNGRALDPDQNFAGTGPAPPPDEDALARALAADSLERHIEAALPRAPIYEAIAAALAHYRDIEVAGGWPPVPPGPTLRPGDHDPRVAALRARLAVTDEVAPAPSTDPEHYDDALERGVRRFQRRHQIDVDGIVGRDTLDALNVPVRRRIDQLRLSLERLRWVQGEVAGRTIVVNIAGFQVFVAEGTEIVWSTRAMVGRAYRQTPVFRSDLTYLEFNPSWTLPPTIVAEDVLPRLKAEPGYLATQHMRVLDLEGREVDPGAVDWNAYEKAVPYLIRQDPGPWNSLGTVKFIFPNPHFVYLHDTPHRELFDNPKRSFSSGCIRVEDPIGLAVQVFDDPSRYSAETFERIVASGETRRIDLERSLPVLILYLTASVRADGLVYFFPDIYGRDAAVLAALDGPVTFGSPR